MTWTVTVDGRTVSEAEMTLAQAMQVQELCGQPWPDPTASAAAMAAVLAVVIADGDPKSLTAALTVVAAMPLAAARAMVTADRG